MESETRYARSGDVNIAYQVAGTGPFDLVMVPGYVSHVELSGRVPQFASITQGLASFCRLIRFDKRGTGMSDPVIGAPTLETRMDDVRAVMDAVGSSRAALFGTAEGASMCLLFAAIYRERTAAVVVRSALPRTLWAPDFPWGRTPEQYDRDSERERRVFGPRAPALEALRALGQFSDGDAEVLLDYLRFGASPGTLEALLRMNRDIDIRHVLSAVRVPVLILHGAEDEIVPREVGHYMVERIPDARLVEIPGVGHLAFGASGAPIVAEARTFLSEVWEAGGWQDREPERTLATVLFTDIVDSTGKALSLGDRGWREVLERHHALVRRELLRFRGREIDNAGDGFLAAFDGPARAIRCACALTSAMESLGLEIRAGLHTGECEVVAGKLAGIALHTGARVAAQAQAREVLVSSTVRDLVAGSGIRFNDAGTHELKGVPGEWRLFLVDQSSAMSA